MQSTWQIKKFLNVALFAILALLVAACSKKTTTAPTELKQELHISIGASPQTLDPHVATGVPAMKVLGSIGEPLVRLDLDTYEVIPATAESWSVNEDGTRYEFKMRDTARWSNGETITAYDFEFAWQRALLPTVGWQYANDYYVITGAEAYNNADKPDPSMLGVKALNPKTLVFELNKPYPLFLKQLTAETLVPIHKSALISQGAIDDVTSDWTLPQHIISNGPFILKTWEINKVMMLEKNPHYWDADNIQLEKVFVYPIETESAEERAFRSGQIQVAYGSRIPVNKIATYSKERPTALHLINNYGIYGYLINTELAPFDNVLVRKALAHAIDRESIVKNITKAGESVADRYIPPTPLYSDLVEPVKYDLELAKKYLADAGYPNGEGLPEVPLLYNTADLHRKIALAVQQMWKQNLGINVRLENQEWKVFLDTLQSGNYSVARYGTVSGIGDPQDFLESYTTGHGMNHTGWGDPEFDLAISEAVNEVDNAKRYAALARSEAIFLENMPTIPIFHYVNSYLVDESVKGLKINSLSRLNLRTVYIEAEERQEDEL